MPTNDATNDAKDGEVLRLVERCLEAMEHSGTDAVDDLLRDHPEHADAVRSRLNMLAATGLLDPEGGPQGRAAWVGAPEDMPEEEEEEYPETLGDFRLLDRIGRGGMGVVYRARQESLGRDVALKLITPSHLYFPGAHQRFRREVEAVARLDHPGIVSIHVVGEDQGIPYFAMECVAGKNLAQVLEALRGRRPEQLKGADLSTAVAKDDAATKGDDTDLFGLSWVDACLHMTLQAGEALAHAHERGVLHRDVKPSNVMITPDGRARLLDFGLAIAEGTASMTRTGAQVGSLPYMAPEQVRGESASVGPHTDVYALGVTLFELLTLRPPYWAENAEQTRQRILEGRPAPMEGLNSSVPWDVETVCQTAMELEPSRRYQSLAGLNEDLRRLLSRQPIRARRSGAILRMRRWAQRNPARAAAILFVTLFVVGGPLVYARLAETARAQEVEERRRADQRLKVAIDAVDVMLLQGMDKDFAAKPGTDPERRRMLDSALKMYKELLAQADDEGLIATRIIRAQTKVSEISRSMGDLPIALASARDAVAGCDKLPDPHGEFALELRAEARHSLLLALFNQGDAEEFYAAFAAQSAEPKSIEAADQKARMHRRAVSTQLAANFKQREGKVDEALKLVGESERICEALLKESPDNDTMLSDLATALERKAYIAGIRDGGTDYVATMQRAVGLFEKALELSSDSPAHRCRLASLLSNWGHLHLRDKRGDLAKPLVDRAYSLLTVLVRQFPTRENYCMDLLSTSQRVGWALQLLGKTSEFEPHVVETIRIGEECLARLPGSDDIASYLALLEGSLARHLAARRDFDAADVHWEKGTERWERLLEGEALQRHEARAGSHYHYLAQYQAKRSRFELAEASAKTAIELHRRMLKRTGGGVYASRLKIGLPLLSRIYISRGNLSAAVATLARGVDDGFLTSSTVSHPSLALSLKGREDYEELVNRAPAAESPGRGR